MDLFPMLLTQVEDALGDAAARSGSWLACRPGCHACCVGVFPVSPYDAEMLRAGLAAAPAAVATRVEARASASRKRLIAGFPGDPETGRLFTEASHEEAFEEFANDEPCPVLDPETGRCELYASRPVPCRTFGPPVRDGEGHLTVCEICFVGAPAEEVERCEMDQGWREAEEEAIAAAAERAGSDAPTVIAFALRRPLST